MTDPLPDLLSPTDFALFKAKDEAWFLGQAGDTIRDFCGWHIWPQLSMINVDARIGNHGIIMLPSLNVVSVEELRWAGTVIAPELYTVHDSGWIELTGATGFVALETSGTAMRQLGVRSVSVDFTHGYEVMPRVVAEVGFELTGKTIEKPSGVVSSLTSGPYRFRFNEFGAVLSEGQAARLGPYAIERMT